MTRKRSTRKKRDPGKKKPISPASAAAELGRRGGKKGGPARARKLTPKRRAEIALEGARARWTRARRDGAGAGAKGRER